MSEDSDIQGADPISNYRAANSWLRNASDKTVAVFMRMEAETNKENAERQALYDKAMAQEGPPPDISDSSRFPDGLPQPMWGLEYMPISDWAANWYGLVQPSGRPDFLNVGRDGIVAYHDEYYQLVTAAERVGQYHSESVREILFKLGLFGHCITANPDEQQGTHLAEGIYKIGLFGIWPEKNPRSANGYLPNPWVGDFGEDPTMTVSAGSHFRGWAAVYDPTQTKPVKLPAFDSEFIPPGKLCLIVPDDDIKNLLQAALGKAFGANFGKLPIPTGFLEERIVSLNDVRQGQLQKIFPNAKNPYI